MRGITLSLLAVLAMSTLAVAAPTLHYEVENYYPGSGMRTFTVYSTGQNVNVLSAFQVSGVHQVWTAADTISEWANNPNNNTPANALDSHVLFGDMRLADLTHVEGVSWGPTVTDETVTGGGTSGLGTLVNTTDAYMKLGTPPDDPNETLPLFQLVVPKGKAVTLQAVLLSALYNPDSGFYNTVESYYFDDEAAIPDVRPAGLGSLVIKSVLDGDANEDGVVDLNDFSILASNYNQSGKTWATADFSGDGIVDLNDFSLLAANYNQAADWYAPAAPAEGAAAAVPEPSTILMLVLGSLCLAGYRLRK